MICERGDVGGGGFEGFDFRDLGAGNDWHLMTVVEPNPNVLVSDSWGAVGRL
jgi:hypothetical protein